MNTSPQLATFEQSGISRRAFLVMPLVLGGWLAYVGRPQRSLPDAAAGGTGKAVELVLFSNNGCYEKRVRVRKLLLPDAEWRRILTGDEFAVTRRAATEPPFTGRYWNDHRAGVYRCVCCGNALFDSHAKFDSGTGWPSFDHPLAASNVFTRPDRTLREVRQEVLCSKCDSHLGHVFADGPTSTGQRYCLNSAALRLCCV